MKKVNLLSKAEMRRVMGGVLPVGDDGGGPCGTSECTADEDCKTTLNPKCHKSTCLSTGEALNFCGV